MPRTSIHSSHDGPHKLKDAAVLQKLLLYPSHIHMSTQPYHMEVKIEKEFFHLEQNPDFC